MRRNHIVIGRNADTVPVATAPLRPGGSGNRAVSLRPPDRDRDRDRDRPRHSRNPRCSGNIAVPLCHCVVAPPDPRRTGQPRSVLPIPAATSPDRISHRSDFWNARCDPARLPLRCDQLRKSKQPSSRQRHRIGAVARLRHHQSRHRIGLTWRLTGRSSENCQPDPKSIRFLFGENTPAGGSCGWVGASGGGIFPKKKLRGAPGQARLKLNRVCWRCGWPGARTVQGKSGRFGASGQPWVSSAIPAWAPYGWPIWPR